MNKNLFLIIAVVAVLIFGFVGLYSFSPFKSTSKSNIKSILKNNSKSSTKSSIVIEEEPDDDTSTNDALSAMAEEEIKLFNSNFTSYEGVQTDKQLKVLLYYCNFNAKNREDDEFYIPIVIAPKLTEEGDEKLIASITNTVEDESKTPLQNYLGVLSEMTSLLESDHSYRVVLTKNKAGRVKVITINYDEDDTDNHIDEF